MLDDKFKKNRNMLYIVFIIVIGFILAFYVKNLRQKNEEKLVESDTSKIKIEEVNSKEKVKDKDVNKQKLEKVDNENNYFKISKESDYKKVADDDKPLILMFGTKLCTYCAQMRPFVNEISNLYRDKVNIRYIDAGELPDLAYKYPIKAVPAVMVRNFDKTGYSPSKDLFQKLSDNYNSPTAYSSSNSKSHDFTMLYGFINRDMMLKIVEELIEHAK